MRKSIPSAPTWSPADLLSHRCSYHADPALNESQARLLSRDYVATKEKLIRAAVSTHLGRPVTPSDLSLARSHLRVLGGEHIKYLYWSRTLLAAYSDPISSISGHIYTLSWYFRQIVSPHPQQKKG